MRRLLIVACVLLLALLALATAAWATTVAQVAPTQATPDFQQDVQQTATRAGPNDLGQQSAVYSDYTMASADGNDLWLQHQVIITHTVATTSSGVRGSPNIDDVESTITPTTPVAQSANVRQDCTDVAYIGTGKIAEQTTQQQTLA